MKIKGIAAATFAAYHPDGSVNTDIIPALVEKLISDGITGIYICGTNGEGPSMTVEERMAVAEAYVKAARKRILILVHVGHTSIKSCRQLAAHAARIGADAFSSVAAFYFKPASVEILVSSMQQIASAAPNLPFYYYHMPSLTGVGMDMVDFLTLGEQQIPNLAGIKYTASTLFEYQACLNYNNKKYDALFGFDEMLLSALAVGAQGAIGSTYTFAAPVYLDIIRRYNNGDLSGAQQLQLTMVNVIRCIVKHPSIAAQRAIMKMIGFDLGDARLPLVSLTAQSYDQLRRDLDELKFFELLNSYQLIA